MANPKHTPGPWSVDVECPTDVLAPKDANILYVVAQDTTVIDVSNVTGMAEREANARLIAAAPELLAAAQQVLVFLEEYTGKDAFDEIMGVTHGRTPVTSVSALIDAIAKATGGAE